MGSNQGEIVNFPLRYLFMLNRQFFYRSNLRESLPWKDTH